MRGFTETFRSVSGDAGDRTAMREGSTSITYRALGQLAGRYRDACLARGLQRGQVVVIERERGIETSAVMIGILLAGGAYTVMAPGYPAHRLAAMREALDVAFVVNADFTPADGDPAEGADVSRSPDDLMYVIFTSGTSSTPKAVGVPDRAVLRLLREPRLGLAPGLRISHLSPIEFDASVLELWGGLLSGMEIRVVSSRQVVDPLFMFDFIANDVDVMWLPSSLFNFIVEKKAAVFAGPRRIIVGGEALSLHHVNLALPYVSVVNGYGPTENTVFTTLDVMEGPSVSEISIGTAVAGTETAALTADGTFGNDGELLAFGEGLAIGYINDPDKTAESFVEIQGRRAYRTGDFVTIREHGRITFKGRLDSQVKVSGYRVDLQEVESAFLACGSGNAKAFVDEGRIVVAVTNPVEGLRDRVSGYLPAYMQPRSILGVESIPLTANGKADVNALKRLSRQDSPVAQPGSAIRQLLAEVGIVPAAGVDNLFELGLDSLSLWKLVNAVNNRTGTALTLFDVLSEPTISALERAVIAGSASSGIVMHVDHKSPSEVAEARRAS